jgi:transposase
VLEGFEIVDSQNEPIAYPVHLAADKSYRAAWIDEYLLDLNVEPVIPSKSNEEAAARPVAFDSELYRERNIIERLVGWLKESRRILSRFEKTAKNFGGMLKMAFILRYLRIRSC